MSYLLPLVLIALAQATPNLQFRSQPRSTHATVAAAPPTDVTVKPGTRVALFVDVTPNPNIHVYAPGSKDYIPITIALERQGSVKIGKVTYPKSEMMTFADERVPVFQKPFRLTQEITLSRSLTPGTTVPVTGTVNFQACDDKVCYPPETASVAWTLTVR